MTSPRSDWLVVCVGWLLWVHFVVSSEQLPPAAPVGNEGGGDDCEDDYCDQDSCDDKHDPTRTQVRIKIIIFRPYFRWKRKIFKSNVFFTKFAKHQIYSRVDPLTSILAVLARSCQILTTSWQPWIPWQDSY